MNHPILDKHYVIGWDADGTLLDGPNSQFFLEYIKAHPKKIHHIITFRDSAWANDLWEELGSKVPFNAKFHIESINSCPEDIYNCYSAFSSRDLATKQRLLASGISENEFNLKVWQFERWKGLKAKELGCTLLVDDLPHLVLQGCLDHDIAFLHAHDRIN